MALLKFECDIIKTPLSRNMFPEPMGPPQTKKPRRSIVVNFSVASDKSDQSLDLSCCKVEADGSLQGNGDTVFDPCAEMLIHDYDDERTLEEEEALESNEDPQTELSDLQKESDMPLSELLAMYGYNEPEVAEDESTDRVDSGDDIEEPSKLVELYPDEMPILTKNRFLRSGSRPQSEEEDEDRDYSPGEEDWKKIIMVGSEYQAKIPVGLFKYDDALPYENDDKILWNPSALPEIDITGFLSKAHDNQSSITHTKDDEQALFLLLQCGYNVEEALRRKRITCVSSTDAMSIWSEEECRNFETGMRIYGKDFYTIQKTKVLTRSVGELVQFYYLWKKTERHDVYAHKSRLEKKKLSLHPGITDYMDRFLEEQDVGTNDSLLMYAENKKIKGGEAIKNALASQRVTTTSPPSISNILPRRPTDLLPS